MMTSDQLKALGLGEQWLDPLNETFDKYDISTPKRQACFLGQTLHESGGFKFTKENLNYSAKALMATWPSRFPSLDVATQYERQPEKIASKVYVGRMGNESPEDAAKFIGRGLIQCTGKENYTHCGEALGVDLIANPHLLEEPRYAVLSAGWFWNKKGLNALADDGTKDSFEVMTKRINGGLLGLDDRKSRMIEALKALGAQNAQ
jgi:putative chitinase